jgi:hypothetical protein
MEPVLGAAELSAFPHCGSLEHFHELLELLEVLAAGKQLVEFIVSPLKDRIAIFVELQHLINELLDFHLEVCFVLLQPINYGFLPLNFLVQLLGPFDVVGVLPVPKQQHNVILRFLDFSENAALALVEVLQLFEVASVGLHFLLPLLLHVLKPVPKFLADVPLLICEGLHVPSL